jgi:N-hydroxyarylamine O-acetyltransferase
MTEVSSSSSTLHPEMIERVLARLGLQRKPEPTLDGLRAVYGAWCNRVPFDNIRKMIHVRSGDPGPLPGATAQDFFEGWLKFGTGGTCWSGAGALHSLLTALGFNATRGIGTMLAAPNLPPNHGTVRVSFDSKNYLVDSSILHGEPLRLSDGEETAVKHAAWGVRCAQQEGRWHVNWRPLHKLDGFQCRLERFGATPDDYRTLYDSTRAWSPFNYEATARSNRTSSVIGVAFGHAVTLRNDGGVNRFPVSRQERNRLLIEDLGLSEEIVERLPEDTPTPPPPGSRTAQTA